MRVLVVEDEERIASFLVKGLRARGYAVEHVATGAAALERARSGHADLVILDLGLPDLDGSEVLAAIRERGDRLPVIVLTARSDVPDRVEALDGGADDYLTKPFAFDELVARVRARLRSSGGAAENPLVVGDVRLDLLTRRAMVREREVELTTREFSLLETFMRHAGQVLTREQLLSRVWGYDFDPGSNVVDVYVRYLRRKFGEDRIQTVRGAGYRFLDDRGGADRLPSPPREDALIDPSSRSHGAA